MSLKSEPGVFRPALIVTSKLILFRSQQWSWSFLMTTSRPASGQQSTFETGSDCSHQVRIVSSRLDSPQVSRGLIILSYIQIRTSRTSSALTKFTLKLVQYDHTNRIRFLCRKHSIGLLQETDWVLQEWRSLLSVCQDVQHGWICG